MFFVNCSVSICATLFIKSGCCVVALGLPRGFQIKWLCYRRLEFLCVSQRGYTVLSDCLPLRIQFTIPD